MAPPPFILPSKPRITTSELFIFKMGKMDTKSQSSGPRLSSNSEEADSRSMIGDAEKKGIARNL
jgi:hypothetical protein